MAIGGSDYLPMYVLAWCRMDALAAGAWVALAARGPGGLPALRPAARWAVMVGFAAVVGLAIKEGGTSARLDGIHTVGFSALALMGAGLLVVAGTSTNRLLCGRTLGTFAKYSYAMYLFHMPVRILLTRYGFTPETWLQQAGFDATTLLLARGHRRIALVGGLKDPQGDGTIPGRRTAGLAGRNRY